MTDGDPASNIGPGVRHLFGWQKQRLCYTLSVSSVTTHTHAKTPKRAI